MEGGGETIEARFRFLRPDEGAVLSEAIRVAYGESYDVSPRARRAPCSATRA